MSGCAHVCVMCWGPCVETLECVYMSPAVRVHARALAGASLSVGAQRVRQGPERAGGLFGGTRRPGSLGPRAGRRKRAAGSAAPLSAPGPARAAPAAASPLRLLSQPLLIPLRPWLSLCVPSLSPLPFISLSWPLLLLSLPPSLCLCILLPSLPVSASCPCFRLSVSLCLSRFQEHRTVSVSCRRATHISIVQTLRIYKLVVSLLSPAAFSP